MEYENLIEYFFSLEIQFQQILETQLQAAQRQHRIQHLNAHFAKSGLKIHISYSVHQWTITNFVSHAAERASKDR